MTETLHNLYVGFSVALAPNVLLYAFVGCVIGTLVGVLPGVGPLPVRQSRTLSPLRRAMLQPPAANPRRKRTG